MKEWQSYHNSYLRHLSLLKPEKDSMTISTLSVQELQSALEQIQIFVTRTKSTKGHLECHGEIKLSLKNSEEMLL